ncbi:tetratricopeptide (TPR) repeat protein [Rhabdobacter roseus]|uniref:Tetratricopeptide (TPR) repeat protein n=1 Tax=Rhabdobacter roseus TaxID=1655419 RepID=A0A840TKN7_9BACT|nr:RagB/SusD family nutrient uptake outer membrane protein [Rhabdobacter roseus]MBB5284061.1 tetratricopeptide (TPR) repeat protein [Rhabdobacter roseus]
MKSILHKLIGCVAILLLTTACQDTFLEETPLAFLSPEGALVNKAGFESAIAAIHQAARDEFNSANATGGFNLQLGTDVATTGDETIQAFKNYEATVTPNSGLAGSAWNWAYRTMLVRANAVIDYAQRPAAVWANEAEKNAIIAEARFFRAYTYNGLANTYGGVPIVDRIYEEPKLDFVRASRQEVYDFARQDLEFAAQWLPETTTQPGRIVKAAAQHLLAEVYISLGEYDKAIASASAVIGSGQFNLMTTRFGTQATQPGDVYADLFKDGNQNRSAGNRETIWALQFEFQAPGGLAGPNANVGNIDLRGWGSFYASARAPNGSVAMVVADSLGRGVGWVRGTNYLFYDLWQDDSKDMRNSPYNIRRVWYYNSPTSPFFRQPVTYYPGLDTMQHVGPMLRKVEGGAQLGVNNGQTIKDKYMMRLAETYLLRAEAYVRKGDNVKAAEDINVVRARAKAKPATPDQLSLDYILDERARELTTEEQRRRTLTRFGMLVERVRKYNHRSSSSIQEKHEFLPIPQSAIDANIGAKLEQNPGY